MAETTCPLNVYEKARILGIRYMELEGNYAMTNASKCNLESHWDIMDIAESDVASGELEMYIIKYTSNRVPSKWRVLANFMCIPA